jgi:hypothetical protein
MASCSLVADMEACWYLRDVTVALVALRSRRGRGIDDVLGVEQPGVPFETLGRGRRLALESKDPGVAAAHHVAGQLLPVLLLQEINGGKQQHRSNKRLKDAKRQGNGKQETYKCRKPQESVLQTLDGNETAKITY